MRWGSRDWRDSVISRRQLVVVGVACTLSLQAGFAQAGSFEDFFSAVKRDDLSTLKRLEAMGFDLNTTNEKGQHALHLALRDEAPKIAAYLVTRPAVNIDRRNLQDETPLMLALLKGQFGLAKALQVRGADVNKPGWTPLHYAATHAGQDAVKQVEWLLELHAYIDAESPNRTTPLMMAAQYGDEAVVDLLLDAGADGGLKNDLGLTAHDFATRASRIKLAEKIAVRFRSQIPKSGW